MEKIWITWNDSTRSRSISSFLGFELYVFDGSRYALIRHTSAAIRTIMLLVKKNPDIIICQYSFLLLIILSIYKSLKKNILLISDCHNKALKRNIKSPVAGRIFWKIKSWSFRNADHIIITNNRLTSIARKLNENIILLKDPLPEFEVNAHTKKPEIEEFLITFVSTFATDEPHELVMEAAKYCPKCRFQITGAPPGTFDISSLPDNVALTGFLDQNDYIQLIYESDAVLSLSREENILQCSTYEAISLETPCITNDTKINKETFKESVVYTALSPERLIESIEYTIKNREDIVNNIHRFKTLYKEAYSSEISPLTRIIDEFSHESHGKFNS